MPDADITSARQTIQEKARRVQGLRTRVYAFVDPTAHPEFAELVRAERELSDLEKTQTVPKAPAVSKGAAEPRPRGRLLGPLTTALEVETKLHMQPVPTGIYHLLDPKSDPLFTVTVR